MFADTQTLNNFADANRIFKLIRQDGTGTTRFDEASSQAEPSTMVIKHQVTGSGPAAVDRHLVSFARTNINTATGKPVTSSVNLTLAVPRDLTITSAEVLDDLISLLHFIIGAEFDPASTFVRTVFDGLVIGES